MKFFLQGSNRPQENARLTCDLGIPDVGCLYLRKRFKLPVQSSGLHSLWGSSWQVPVVTKWWVLRGGALDFRTAPAPGLVLRTALPSLPKADTWHWLAVPTAGAETGPQQHPLCFTPHLPLSSQENTYSSQKQSRHKVIYAIQMPRRLHLTQNSNKSSDKLRRKKLRQVEKVSNYIPSSSFWKATSSAHHRKGCLPLLTNNTLLFHYLQLVLILAEWKIDMENPCRNARVQGATLLLIDASCLGREAGWSFPPCLFIYSPENKLCCSDTLGLVLSKCFWQKK